MAIPPEKLRFIETQRAAVAGVVGEAAAREIVADADVDAHAPFKDVPLSEHEQWCIAMRQHRGMAQGATGAEGEAPKDAPGP